MGSKLTEQQQQFMKEHINQYKQREFAQMFGVSIGLVNLTLQRLTKPKIILPQKKEEPQPEWPTTRDICTAKKCVWRTDCGKRIGICLRHGMACPYRRIAPKQPLTNR